MASAFVIDLSRASLTLHTQPLTHFGHLNSYFSPIAESPYTGNEFGRVTGNETFPFPRQLPSVEIYREETTRYTAPTPSRSHMSHMAPGRSIQRPSLPPNTGSSIKSTSHPHMHKSTALGHRIPNDQQPGVPEVPPFPTHHAYDANASNGRTQYNFPSILHIKVHIPSHQSKFTLIVNTNIGFLALRNRIEAKFQRFANLSMNNSWTKLKYLDDNDYITIDSEEDLQIAFEIYRDQPQDFNPIRCLELFVFIDSKKTDHSGNAKDVDTIASTHVPSSVSTLLY